VNERNEYDGENLSGQGLLCPVEGAASSAPLKAMKQQYFIDVILIDIVLEFSDGVLCENR